MQEKPETVSLDSDGTCKSTDFVPLPDSSNYLQKLESKLSKVKGVNKKLTPKDMLSVMQSARDDIMSHLILSSSNQDLFFEEDREKEVSASYLEKKLFPEKNGVTYEELQHLLECDVLAKTVAEKSSDSSNDSTTLDR